MLNTLALIAGGKATRLKPVSESIPKSLIEINGRPFISYQLALLKSRGIHNVIICAGYLGNKIKNYLGDGNKSGINLKYSFDGGQLLGTGGAVMNAFSLLPDKFWVMYGDSYLDTDFSVIYDFYKSSGLDSLMTVYRNSDNWDKSNVVFDGYKIIKYDKINKVPEMNHIDYGLGILSKDSFRNFAMQSKFDLAEVYQDLLGRNQLAGYEVAERFYEIGSFQGISDFEEYVKLHDLF